MYWQNQDDHVALRSATGHVEDDGSLGLISMKQDKKAAGEYQYSIGIRSEHKLFLSCRASRASDGGHRISRPGGPARCVCLNQLGQGGRSARGAERGSPVFTFSRLEDWVTFHDSPHQP